MDDLHTGLASRHNRRLAVPRPVEEVERARVEALAAVGALNRKDIATLLLIAQNLLRVETSALAAVDVLTDIVLDGFPRGGVVRGTRLDSAFGVPPGEVVCERAAAAATDLLAGLVAGADVLPAAVELLRGEHALDVLVVLIRAATARIESFVALDGDTGDAYYAYQRGAGV
ncbi:hypothetical protein [Umezawaea beigongshangensis]|uniref:hypothetical protein n=1 Tax=Umezawaea beigongshangensis TaxID=2780383 RepID=UPI0018F1F514|nr:hypothetical protein [Umezawaea beigongshangensis]